MKFSVNWLGEFAELPSSVDDLAELLTLAGTEIENIEKRGAKFENVVVAQIEASAQHPNADRLSVCQVDDGSGQERQIVCGAKNYKVGDKVPLALPGAVLVGDLRIKPSNLRGVESQGMLCSPSELGLQADGRDLLVPIHLLVLERDGNRYDRPVHEYLQRHGRQESGRSHAHRRNELPDK